jgi:hypothetical protein
VITNLVKAAKQSVEIAAAPALGAEANKTDFSVDATFDPFDQGEVNSINENLKAVGGSVSPLICPQNVTHSAGGVGETAGLLYRVSYPFPLTFRFSGVANSKSISLTPAPAGMARFVVNLPSKFSPIMSLDPSRTAFGKNPTTISFASGVLTEMHVEKDSEIAGLSAVPVDTTDQLLSLPKDLLTVRYDNVSAQDK